MKQVQLNYEKTQNVYPKININNIAHNNKALSESFAEEKSKILDKMYPVGSIFMTANSTYDPSQSLIPGSNWIKIKPGRVLVGKGSFTDVNGEVRTFDTELTNIGDYNTPCPPVPSHRHGFASNQKNDDGSSCADAGNSTSNLIYSQGFAGGDAPHANIMPCYAVNIWRRLPDVIPSLEEASWDFISQMAREGIAEYLWEVGDSKSLGTSKVIIVDFKGQYTEELVYDANNILTTPKSKGITFMTASNSSGILSNLTATFHDDFLYTAFSGSIAQEELNNYPAGFSSILNYIRPVVKKRHYYTTDGTLTEETMNNLKLWFPNSIEVKIPCSVSPIIAEHFDYIPNSTSYNTILPCEPYYYTKATGYVGSFYHPVYASNYHTPIEEEVYSSTNAAVCFFI